MNKYIYAYLIGGLIGYVIENKLLHKNIQSGDTINRLLHINIPFLHVWSVGCLVLMMINEKYGTNNIFLLSIISGTVLAFFECVIGKISLKFNGYHTWNYEDGLFPMCDNYISIDVLGCWIFMSFMFFSLYQHFTQE